MISVCCDNCGTKFDVYPSRIENKKYLFCSKKCEGEFRKLADNVECIVCCKNFHVKPTRLKRIKNKDKNICCSIKCSNKLKEIIYMGENNPNFKYEFDRDMFEKVDSEIKAYLLGWIASDGHVGESGFVISIKNIDVDCLKNLRNFVNPDIPICCRDNDMVSLSVNSKKISNDLCNLLNIEPGKKSLVVQFPSLDSNELKWAFVRGYFDGDGYISRVDSSRWPRCGISSCSKSMIDGIASFCEIPYFCYTGKDRSSYTIEWNTSNALNFLGKLYENTNYYLRRKRDRYIDWCLWQPSLSGNGNWGRIEQLKWNKIKENAVPTKKFSDVTNSGYDVTLVEKVKQSGMLEYYTTNIKIQPPYGFYFDLVPRSSMPKTGYILANHVGIIDRSYTGPIMAVMIKIDQTKPDLELPARVVQLVPRQIVHFEVKEVDSLDETERGGGGFGSTGKA